MATFTDRIYGTVTSFTKYVGQVMQYWRGSQKWRSPNKWRPTNSN